MASFKMIRRDVGAGLDAGGVTLDELKGFELDFNLGRGQALAEEYPKKLPIFTVTTEATAASGPRRGRAKVRTSNELTDLLRGGDPSILVVSERMKAMIATVEDNVEFLPVTIQGYKERYFIANFLPHIPCLDLKASGAKSGAEPRRIVLKRGAVPANRALFQVQEWPQLFLIRADLAETFTQEGLTGIDIIDFAEYRSTLD